MMLARECCGKGRRAAILATDETLGVYAASEIPCKVFSMGSRKHPETIAANLFRLLRKVDEMRADAAFAEAIGEDGIGLAIMNRLAKAAGGRVVYAAGNNHK